MKPANLFVARKGVEFDFLKVLDFGLVKRWQSEPDASLTESLVGVPAANQTAMGQIVGTPAFLAPRPSRTRPGWISARTSMRWAASATGCSRAAWCSKIRR